MDRLCASNPTLSTYFKSEDSGYFLSDDLVQVLPNLLYQQPEHGQGPVKLLNGDDT